MHLDHIALWTSDIERLKEFYSKSFACMASRIYENPEKQFSSYFLSFPSGARIEIMQRADIKESSRKEMTGIAHFAICVGTSEDVDDMTERFENEGVKVVSYPRKTGDGYYESVILDPDNNLIELVACK
jgi:lactoylglutathione lyase